MVNLIGIRLVRRGRTRRDAQNSNHSQRAFVGNFGSSLKGILLHPENSCLLVTLVLD